VYREQATNLHKIVMIIYAIVEQRNTKENDKMNIVFYNLFFVNVLVCRFIFNLVLIRRKAVGVKVKNQLEKTKLTEESFVHKKVPCFEGISIFLDDYFSD
jgi:hypothetical protein